MLLDAPFTAIDNRLKQSIMEKVATILTRLRLIFFINANSIVTITKKVVLGILKRQKRTVVMTSDTSAFDSLAQHVLVLEGGRVKVQGSYEQVKHVFPESQEKKAGSGGEENQNLPKSRGAKQRWAKLKIVTKCGMIMKDTIEKKKNYKLPVKESVQDAFVSRLGPMMMLMTLKILLIVNFYPS